MFQESRWETVSMLPVIDPVPDPTDPQVPAPAFAWAQSSTALSGKIVCENPDWRRYRAVTFVGSAVRRNPHSIRSALVSASHVPLHYTASVRRLHSPPPRRSGRSVPEHPSAGG